MDIGSKIPSQKYTTYESMRGKRGRREVSGARAMVERVRGRSGYRGRKIHPYGRAGESLFNQPESLGEQRVRPEGSQRGNCQEKPLPSISLTVPQTDTGRQGENPQACEITLVKELGNLAP